MANIKKLSKLLQREPEKKAAETKQEAVREEQTRDIDTDALTKIVDRMREKYIKEGVLTEDAEYSEKIADLRRVLEGGQKFRITGAGPKELLLFENPIIRMLAKFYSKLESPIKSISNLMYKRFGKGLEMNILSADMPYTVEQYLAVTVTAMVIVTMITFFLTFLLAILGKMPIILMLLASLFAPALVFLIAFMIPRSKAASIGSRIDKELPFALRHMSIEIRAGVGIYKTMESISKSNYGPLSEGFEWVLFNIEKGMSTEDALETWARKTKSEPLKRVVSHLVRALRTGGNLSDIMVTIAEDIAFEQKMKISDFAEKLNLLGLFLMMISVVFPIMITILATIGSSPAIKQYLGMFSFFSPSFLMLIYFVICPAMIGMFMFFIKSSDPG